MPMRHPIWRPAAGREASALGVVSSAVLHAALIGVCAVLTREPGQYAKGGSTELVRFLVPPDRVPTRKIATERIEWVRLGIPDGWGISDVDGARLGSEIAATSRRGERGVDPELEFRQREDLDELLGGDQVFNAFEVDSTVERSPESGAPFYPADLLLANVEGNVRARYVVDTAGRVDSTTIEILSATHPAFALAVLEAAPRMRFRPAVAAGRKVAQLVEQNFEFRVSQRTEKVTLRGAPRGRMLAGRPVTADRPDHAT
jgi:TonB family protein